MKSIKILSACLVASLAFCGASSVVYADDNAKAIENETYPNVHEYQVTSQDESWKINKNTRLFILKNDKTDNKHFEEVVKLMDAEFASKLIPSSEVMPIVSGEEDQINKHDIVITLGEVSGYSSDEAYQIDIDKTIKLTANDSDGILYGLRTIMNYMQIKGEMPFGTIIDYPDIEERSLHLDIARKYYPKDWIINEIKEMSAMKLNTLQLHFSENEGFRIESKKHPEIVSSDTNNVVGTNDEENNDNKGYLTQEEVKEIIETAKLYGIDIIPSFDAPGHLTHILDVHPEYRLKKNGYSYEEAGLDITNPDAVAFIKEIYVEYAQLFNDSKYFQIGGDEFIDFGKITSVNYPDIYNACMQTSPESGIHKPIDVYIAYLNDISTLLEEKGFVTRVWSDGIYRNDTGQTLDLKSSVQVDYWTRWSDNMATLDTILDKNHDIINFNDNYFYYVLNEHNYKYPTAPAIYNEWNLSVFSPKRRLQFFTPDHVKYSQYKGASFSVWSNDPNKETRESVANGIYKPMSVMAAKTWNANLQENYQSAETFNEFEDELAILGHAAGYNTTLPTSNEITYLENKVTENTDNKLENEKDNSKNTNEESKVEEETKTEDDSKVKEESEVKVKEEPKVKEETKIKGEATKVEKGNTVETSDASNYLQFVYMLSVSGLCIIGLKRKSNH